MEFSELLQTRACVRSYSDTPVTREQMKAILEAGIRAPNACNMQSWHFWAVCDKNTIDAFHPTIAHISWISHISLLIVVCINEKIAASLEERFGERGRMFAVQDTAGAVNHMLLKATDIGLGGCWIGPMNVDKCREHLGIPADFTPVAILTIGTPAGDVRLRNRKPLEEVITVIGELPEGVPEETPTENQPYALEHACLPGSRFEDLNLQDAVFDDIYMKNATFNNICMEGVRFTDINMSMTSYCGLNLSRSDFGCVDFSDTRFENPCFDGSVFKNCSFRGVTFENCTFDATIVTKDGKKIPIH